MSYCENCGRQILDESLGCPVCNVRNNIDPSKTIIEGQAEEIKVETVEEFTVEDNNGTSQKFESRVESDGSGMYRSSHENHAEPVNKKTIHPVLKVVIIVAILMTGWIGEAAGLIAGMALMKSPIEDYRKFGKTLVTLCTVLLALSLLCCVIGSVTNMLAIPYYY